jgi:hypothetical protein
VKYRYSQYRYIDVLTAQWRLRLFLPAILDIFACLLVLPLLVALDPKNGYCLWTITLLCDLKRRFRLKRDNPYEAAG